MKSFIQIIEAKVEPNLLRTVPAGSAERHFVARHPVSDILASFRANKDNSPFDGTAAKIYPRKENHFGNDELESIKSYDESIKINEKKHHEIKSKPRHVFMDGKYIGSTEWEPNNKKALKSWLDVHPHEKNRTKIKISTESLDETQLNELSKNTLERYKTAAKKSKSENILKPSDFDRDKDGNVDNKKIDKKMSTVTKRIKGRDIAKKKLAKEEVELSEASKSVMKYANKDFKAKENNNIDKKNDKDSKVNNFIANMRKKKD
jgi:hypothetical protein